MGRPSLLFPLFNFFFFFNFLEPYRGFGRFGMGEFGCVLGIGDLVDCGLGKGILEGFGRCRQYPVKGLGGDEAAVRVFFFFGFGVRLGFRLGFGWVGRR